MAFTFDLAAAINQISTMEETIVTPTPGIQNSYGYGLNPSKFTDPDLLPAIVHVPLGPTGPIGGAEIYTRNWEIHYGIYSRLLFIEAIPEEYPGDETAANLIWKGVAETFLNDTNKRTLLNVAGGINYVCIFEQNSYAVRPWPPVRNAPNVYWSLQYLHRFTIIGG